jgi:hypothetical protein
MALLWLCVAVGLTGGRYNARQSWAVWPRRPAMGAELAEDS